MAPNPVRVPAGQAVTDAPARLTHVSKAVSSMPPHPQIESRKPSLTEPVSVQLMLGVRSASLLANGASFDVSLATSSGLLLLRNGVW
jgi:hypothetical protein